MQGRKERREFRAIENALLCKTLSRTTSAPLVVRWKRIRTVCLSAGFDALHRVGFAATVVSHLVSQHRSFPQITDSESRKQGVVDFTRELKVERPGPASSLSFSIVNYIVLNHSLFLQESFLFLQGCC